MIIARGLTKRFGKIVALDNVTVEIPEGVNLILGPNGGGKSTFFKLSTGVYRPTSGLIRVFGRDPWRDAGVKMKLGVAYDPVLFPPLVSGREWLEFIAKSKGYGEDEVERIGKLLGLDFLDEQTRNYSSGMLKKLALAQAFIGSPELVMIDEPLANLDFESIRNFVRILKGEKKERSFVIISHIWEPLMPIADRVYVIAGGKLVLSGEKEDVRDEIERLFRLRMDV
ncbi:ABC transporter ATP-binding protein [Thermococcus waiotapuensis]|uniref:ABC transporter ATP-binding protein n=1 Tax=Thermococcus waiotapuensis TaxID=90909 RepID=A0AAE4NX69_9EURY|nr:ABC transporter ATP-binding protein [Thermococcus waiotapuensis]MDV3104340.1 ABC transporter ATP-binding protein [Thermococcus waiotapuensis]